MYLRDVDIRARLDELDVESPDIPFDPDGQIQPCSIDLRLSPLYWKPQRPPRVGLIWPLRYTVDFAANRFSELNPRRHWSRRVLEPGECLTLKPGDMVLGRIHERLTIPADCAGHLEGRSSFARMGLTVHATGGFINPGWRGHMPLTIVNHGRFVLRIPAYLPICQLMLVGLGGKPLQIYGDKGLQSKYVDDDGGPSYWWRDKMLTRLLEEMGRVPAGAQIQTRLLERIGPPSDAVLERLERLVQSRAYTQFGNADELLEIFSRREDRQRVMDKVLLSAVRAFAPIMVALTLASLFETPFGLLHYLTWAITLLSIPVTALAFSRQPTDYLGQKELRQIENLRAQAQP